ncbi:MAG: TetR/AcrR family transcriptional regulator [Bacteroidetes bacterium]|nr:TetR/AcrR family transcriptional regulator [Bacteroidota bacterium]
MTYGIRSVSMDDICRELGISKKTLYQYVSSKANLIEQTLLYDHEQVKKEYHKIFTEYKNAIDQLLMVSFLISKKLSEFNPSFNHDLRKYFPASNRENKAERQKNIAERIKKNIELGIKQGMFRENLNPELVAQLYVQKIEGIMNPENLQISGYSFSDIFKAMFENHIRGIANQTGIEYYEEKIKSLNIKI